MKLYSKNDRYKLYQGNMLDMLEMIKPSTIDSIVTDPPYELNFMGKGWDNAGVSFQKETWRKCYEVLKPGGYLLAFGGSRTFHRIACAIEDAGFEIRDTIMWLYGSGFPKSMDISKRIDKRPNKTYEAKIRFGELIKKYRNKSNLTQRQLGELIGVSRELINLYEIKGNYQQQIPTKAQWNKIKEVLNIPNNMDYIYEEAEREVIGKKESGCFNSQEKDRYTIGSSKSLEVDITIPSTDLAKQWQGWGTALKPSFEPIIVARKPFKGSLVDNVIKNGVGGINIDECRVGTEERTYKGCGKSNVGFIGGSFENGSKEDIEYNVNGRFPANTILTYDETDFDEVCGGFPNTKSGSKMSYGSIRKKQPDNCYKLGFTQKEFNDGQNAPDNYGDSGSASRYFYCAKASKKDRDEGLDNQKEQKVNDGRQTPIDNPFQRGETPRKNTHPTVKPTSLMQYLVRLVTPNGGTILDPFNGSGSTGKAVMYENLERGKNYKYIGIELTSEYLPIAQARIEYVCNQEQQTTIDDFIGDSNE